MRQTPDRLREIASHLKGKMNLRSLVVTLAAIVVFTTTYMLILPAFTLDSQSAAEQGGVDVPAVEMTADDTSDITDPAAADGNAAANDAKSDAEQAEASDGTKADQSAEKAGAGSKEPDKSAAKVKDADPEKSDVKLLTGKKTITARQGKGDDFAVSAVVSSDAKVPADVTITATELGKKTDGFDYDQYKEDALAALKKDSNDVKSIKSIKFYDISLESESQDKSVEPSAPVSVRISYEDGMKVSDADNIRIVHFAEQKNGTEKAQVLDANKNNVETTTAANGSKVTEASFVTDGFSKYAVVEVETIEKTVITADGKTYKVSVSYDKNAMIPEGSELEVKELTGDDYDAYLEKAASKLDKNADDFGMAKFFDITIWNGDDEVKIASPVDVEIKLLDSDNLADSTQVLHFASEDKADVVDSTVSGDTVKFEAEGFSVYAVIDGATDEKARITVNFYGTSSTSPVKTYYVKEGDEYLGTGERDPEKQYIEDIVVDPGVGGTLPSGKLFRGWSIDSAAANTDENYDTENYGAAYTSTTKPYTIEEIQEYLSTLEITEGQTLNIYAMIFNVYSVTYEDPDGVTMAAEDVIFSQNETHGTHTIDQSYTPTDQTHNFEGWNVKSGASNISNAKFDGEDATPPYQMGTTMDISGDVVLSVNQSEGHWLIFEENGSSATYNAPVFVKSEETSQPPALEMKRPGYTFAGWYKLKDGETLTDDDKDEEGNYIIGEKFEEYPFNIELEDTTTLYAKWNVSEKAKYTVVVWTQSVADDKNATDVQKTYDYAFSTQIEEDSNTPVRNLDLSEYQSMAGGTKTVDGKQYSFYGFKYNTTQTAKEGSGYITIGNGVVANKDKVAPNDTTVINLYYDRELVTYDFLVLNGYRNAGTPDWNSGTTYYYRSGNNYYQCSRIGNTTYYYVPATNLYTNRTYYAQINGNWYEYTYVNTGPWYNPNYQWVVNYEGQYYLWDGPVYSRNQVTGWNPTYYVENWQSRDTYTGLYGQKLAKYDYVWPTDYRWLNDLGGGTFTSIQDIFEQSVNENPDSPFHSNFYGEETPYNTNVYHYLQNVDGSYSSNPTYTIPTVVGNGMVFRSFQGYTASVFRIKLPENVRDYQTGTSYNGDNLVNPTNHRTTYGGWTDWFPYGTGVEYDGNTRHETIRWNATEGGIEFRYTRNKYDLTYMVGRFVNKDGATMPAPITGTLKTEEDIPYESSMSNYAKTGSDYYNPDEDHKQTGYVFAGWYLDETCTIEAKFDGTMPLNGMTVYGKWQQVEYRVFLHPNAAPNGVRDTTLNWGSENQQTNFRVSYNEKVSVPMGTRNGYNFIGWYTDEACTIPYNADTRLTDTTVPETPVYDKTKDMTDNANGSEMDKWGMLVDEGVNKDVDRYWITRKLNLYAKWSAVIVGADGIGVHYDANGGSNAPSDSRLYKDNITAVAQAASTPPTDDQQFLHWVLQKWEPAAGEDGSGAYVDIEGPGAVVYPGENYTVLLENARRVERTNDDGSPMIIDGQQQYTYTIQLRAEYGPKKTPTPTHIDWYRNDGTPASDTPLHQDKDLQINQAVIIYTTDTGESIPVREGFEFLGWAREREYEIDEDGKPTGPAITNYPNLTKDDLFLKYVKDGDSYKYQAENSSGEWVDVTHIAADESMPYHGLYAVWEKKTFKVDIKKIVESGIDADKAKINKFTITYSYNNGTADVTGTVKLAHNDITSEEESAPSDARTILEVPYDAVFTVTETGSEATDFTKSYSATYIPEDETDPVDVDPEASTENSFKIKGDTTITVTNTRNAQKVRIIKTDMSNPGQPLKDAVFLLNGELELTSGEDGILTAEDESNVFELEQQDTAHVLKETQAPDGYMPLTGDVLITVNANGVSAGRSDDTTVHYEVTGPDDDGVYTIKVTNSSGQELPMTGGIGTTIFYVLGSLLVVGCGIVLVSRRRMGSDK